MAIDSWSWMLLVVRHHFRIICQHRATTYSKYKLEVSRCVLILGWSSVWGLESGEDCLEKCNDLGPCGNI